MMRLLSHNSSRSFLSFSFTLLLVSLLGLASHAQADTVTVLLFGGPGQGSFRFSPAEIQVRLGDTVEWINMSPSPIMHTVTYGVGSDDPGSGYYFDSGLLGSGESFSYTFMRRGDFPYYCVPHEAFGMTGLVKVGPQLKLPYPLTR